MEKSTNMFWYIGKKLFNERSDIPAKSIVQIKDGPLVKTISRGIYIPELDLTCVYGYKWLPQKRTWRKSSEYFECNEWTIK